MFNPTFILLYSTDCFRLSLLYSSQLLQAKRACYNSYIGSVHQYADVNTEISLN